MMLDDEEIVVYMPPMERDVLWKVDDWSCRLARAAAHDMTTLDVLREMLHCRLIYAHKG